MATENRSAKQDEIAIRRTKALELRARGKGFQEIADTLGVSIGTAHTDVRTAMVEYAKEAEGNIQAERGIELRRLERALTVVEEVLLHEEPTDAGEDGDILGMIESSRELKLKALDRLVKIQEQRAKLLGLYAPERRELEAKVAAVALEDLDAMKAAALANECDPSPSGTTDEPEPNS